MRIFKIKSLTAWLAEKNLDAEPDRIIKEIDEQSQMAPLAFYENFRASPIVTR